MPPVTVVQPQVASLRMSATRPTADALGGSMVAQSVRAPMQYASMPATTGQVQQLPPGHSTQRAQASYTTVAPGSQAVTIACTPQQLQQVQTMPGSTISRPMVAPGFQQMPMGGSLTFAVTPAPVAAVPTVAQSLQALPAGGQISGAVMPPMSQVPQMRPPMSAPMPQGLPAMPQVWGGSLNFSVAQPGMMLPAGAQVVQPTNVAHPGSITTSIPAPNNMQPNMQMAQYPSMRASTVPASASLSAAAPQQVLVQMPRVNVGAQMPGARAGAPKRNS